MKNLFFLLAFCFYFFTASASHVYGGYISAKQLNGRVFSITAVVLTDLNSPANAYMETIPIDFGDGKTVTVTRTAISSEDNIQRNTYTIEHQYPTDGVFTLTYTHPNLTANIVNVNGGFSDNVPFTTSCLIRVNSTIPHTQSATPLAFEYVNGCVNLPITYNATFTGDDAYTISHELVSEHTGYTNYILPTGSSINPYSGMLTFTSPQKGLFLFVIRTSCYANGTLISQSNAIQMVNIMDCSGMGPSVVSTDAPYDDHGWYRRVVSPNEQITQLLTFTSAGPDDFFSGEVYTELFAKGATTHTTHPSGTAAEISLSWDALPEYQRNTPYFVTYRYRSNTINLIYDYNIAFYHGAPVNTGINEMAAAKGISVIYPNPVVNGYCTLLFSLPTKGIVNVYDALGRQMISQMIEGQSLPINTEGWKPGLYTYSLLQSSNAKSSGKFIIE